MEATRADYGPEKPHPLQRSADRPGGDRHEIAVMKGIAANFVMTTEELQPIYLEQRQILTDLVDLLSDNEDRYLEPMFAADWQGCRK